MTRIDRRSFLALGGGALAWACARSDGTDAPASPADLSVVPTALLLGVGDSRQGIVLLRNNLPITPEPTPVRLTPPVGSPVEVEASVQQIHTGLGGSDDHEHPEGTEVIDMLVVRHELSIAGVWLLELEVDGDGGQAAFQVTDDSEAPLVGQRAVASQSPTTDDPRGVDPICTRRPPCEMHRTSIAEALEAGQPLVAVFATPRYCTSRVCGPVVDVVEDESRRHAEDASFVHIEVWRDDGEAVGSPPEGHAPAFAEWHLGTEPWTYFVDAGGVVRDRWLGPVGTEELREAVAALVAG